ncbi:hypothetical protein [Mixta sp.]|uniref:hypothetical protein n=1 Tax=Mixta sp. TaxID=2100765 RepID=UPI0025897EC2|nr:hypothetical protein [Mixta sp.]MCR1565904.1 hypothetical protein [Mixta sp.]
MASDIFIFLTFSRKTSDTLFAYTYRHCTNPTGAVNLKVTRILPALRGLFLGIFLFVPCRDPARNNLARIAYTFCVHPGVGGGYEQ